MAEGTEVAARFFLRDNAADIFLCERISDKRPDVPRFIYKGTQRVLAENAVEVLNHIYMIWTTTGDGPEIEA